jgi:D-sedoheptulose 7-phosphate isomerase
MAMLGLLSHQIDATVSVLEALKKLQPQIDRATQMIVSTLKQGGKLLICGNGGSAAESGHFATELVGRYYEKRRSLAAINLSGDAIVATCIGNDYGFENAFSRQIEGLGKEGDLVVALSSSGDSANIIEALKKSRQMGLASLSLLGRGGGKAKGLASCEIIVPGESGRAAQEAHLFLIHYFCEAIDKAEGPKMGKG